MIFNTVLINNSNADTTDATATQEEIFKDKTAYIKSGKVTGTFTLEQEIQEQNSKITEIEQLLSTKMSGATEVKPEQEKEININKNGTTIVVPDVGKVLSKVTINTLIEDDRYKDIITGLITIFSTEEPVLRVGVCEYCRKLIEANTPNLIEIPADGFKECYKLTKINAPKATLIGIGGLFHTGFTELLLPSVETVKDDGLRACHHLEKVDLPKCSYIEHKAMADGAISTLILRNTTMATLQDNTIFANSPISTGTGYIYVPKSLIEQYKADANWSIYAAQFRAIEDYPDICG